MKKQNEINKNKINQIKKNGDVGEMVKNDSSMDGLVSLMAYQPL